MFLFNSREHTSYDILQKDYNKKLVKSTEHEQSVENNRQDITKNSKPSFKDYKSHKTDSSLKESQLE